LTYGPWYASGANGRTEFEQDDSLVPWNYGGFELMNLAANSRVNDSLSNQMEGEGGTIEIPGPPSINMGSALIAGGPYVTGVEVTVGLNGVRSIYRMETWTQRFGRIAKSMSDRANRLNKALRDQKRNLIEWNRQAGAVPNSLLGFSSQVRGGGMSYDIDRIPVHRKGHTSSLFLIAETIPISGGTYRNLVAAAPSYNIPAMLGGPDYSGKALVSLDALFVPFSTHKTKFWNLPHFEQPTASGSSGRSVDELNPYASGNNIYTVAKAEKLYGSGIPEDTHLNDMVDDWQRPIAFKTPMILAGWGYDTNGKPVPNLIPSGTAGAHFASGYMEKPNLWKVGPLDVRWDQNRKVWATGGGAFRVAQLRNHLSPQAGAPAYFLTPVVQPSSTPNARVAGWITDSGTPLYVYDPFDYTYPATPSGARILIQQEETSKEWFVFGAGAW
jgi:hypothetical protein